jgi:cell division septal protein FtsQ
MHKPKTNKTLYFIIAVLAIILVALVVLVVQNQSSLKKIEEKTTISSDYVVSKLSEQESLAGKTPTYIKQLTKADIDELIKTYPAIYGGAEPGYFDVRYDDRWIIYDAVNEKIVKNIVVQGMIVG